MPACRAADRRSDGFGDHFLVDTADRLGPLFEHAVEGATPPVQAELALLIPFDLNDAPLFPKQLQHFLEPFRRGGTAEPAPILLGQGMAHTDEHLTDQIVTADIRNRPPDGGGHLSLVAGKQQEQGVVCRRIDVAWAATTGESLGLSFHETGSDQFVKLLGYCCSGYAGNANQISHRCWGATD